MHVHKLVLTAHILSFGERVGVSLHRCDIMQLNSILNTLNTYFSALYRLRFTTTAPVG